MILKGVGVLRSLLPTSSFEHVSMGQAIHPSTQQDQRAVRALMPTLRGAHCTCVITKRRGCLHRLAHAAERGHFFGASTSKRTVSRLATALMNAIETDSSAQA